MHSVGSISLRNDTPPVHTHTHTHTTRIIPIPNNLLTNNLICRSKPYIYTLVVPKRSSLRVSPRASFPARTSSGTTKTYQNFLLPTPTPEFAGNITRTKKHVAQQHTFTKQIKFKSFSEYIPIELLCNRRLTHDIYSTWIRENNSEKEGLGVNSSNKSVI